MRAIFITPEEQTSGFEPVMWLRSQEMIGTLSRMGVETRPVAFSAFATLCKRRNREIERFAPDFITAPNFNYFLIAANAEGQLPRALDKPVVAMWDDPLGALANCMLYEDASRPAGLLSRVLRKIGRADPTGTVDKAAHFVMNRKIPAIQMFAQVMRHPLLRHFSWDSGHIEAVEFLGLLEAQRAQWYPIATYRPFLETGLLAHDIPKTRDVTFCGNVYPSSVNEHAAWKNDFLRALTKRICERKLKDLYRPIWDILLEEIEELPQSARETHGLHAETRAFWEYYLFTVWQAANTLVRLAILSGIKKDVNLFGMFADPKSTQALQDYPNLRYQGNVHHFNELPTVYASTRINVCVANGLVYKGISSKLIDCLASGGFALTDPKPDLLEFFGPMAEKIFFRTVDELNWKIEYYLTHPLDREEIVQALGEKIRKQCTLEALFERILRGLW